MESKVVLSIPSVTDLPLLRFLISAFNALKDGWRRRLSDLPLTVNGFNARSARGINSLRSSSFSMFAYLPTWSQYDILYSGEKFHVVSNLVEPSKNKFTALSRYLISCGPNLLSRAWMTVELGILSLGNALLKIILNDLSSSAISAMLPILEYPGTLINFPLIFTSPKAIKSFMY